MRNLCIKIIDAEDDSADITSSHIDASQLMNCSIQVVCSDTDADGTVAIQGSNDFCAEPRENFTPTNWVNLDTVTVTNGVASTLSINPLSVSWLRVKFTQATPGTGTMTVNLNAQGF